VGVRPNSRLAKECGLEVNDRGGIVVNEYLKTSDPSIYAVSDIIEVKEFGSEYRTMIPLAPGGLEKYNGTQGTAIVKVFDLSVATVGVNEKVLKSRGLELNKDYFTGICRGKHS